MKEKCNPWRTAKEKKVKKREKKIVKKERTQRGLQKIGKNKSQLKPWESETTTTNESSISQMQ